MLLRKYARTAENDIEKFGMAEIERIEKVLVKLDASSARLLEIVAALRKIKKSREEE